VSNSHPDFYGPQVQTNRHGLSANTFSSMLNSCSTCHASSWSCPGHSGHIELPVHVYNVTFFDQLYRLLRAQCVHCHRLKLARVQINAYICKLRLLQYGLVDDVAQIDTVMRNTSSAPEEGEDDSDNEEDPESVMERRLKFVKERIRKAQKHGQNEGLIAGAKDPVAAEHRRELVKEFLKDIVAVKKCTSCS
jgi:DNA-directed RNA polymerase I subunit RPA1